MRLTFSTYIRLVSLVNLMWFGTITCASEIQLIQKVDRLATDKLTPPTTAEAWNPFHLPQYPGDFLPENFRTRKMVWYRFPVEAGWSGQALYIYRHNMSLAVYLDEQYLGGEPETPFGWRPITWNAPVLLDLPVDLNKGQFIYIRLESGPSGVLLPPVEIGPREGLKDRYEWRRLMQTESSQWALTICLIMGLLSFWLWRKRPDEKLYLRFTLLCACYSLSTSFAFLTFIPFDLRPWLVLIHTVSDWSNYLLVSFVTLALGWQMPRLLTSLKWLAIIATLVHLIVPDSLFLLSAFLVMAPQQLLLTGFGILVLWRTLRPPPSPQLWFGLAFAGMFIFQGHDAFIFFLSPREQYIEAINWMHLSLPLVAIAFYSHLLTRFVNALQDSEALNSELESRVRETTFALEQSYRENRQMELERAAAEERSKIYRDLHDDVGSRLVSIIHTDNQQTSELARDALESLRQTIHTVNHQDESLKDFVANLTEEARLRLNGAGLAFSSSAALESDPALAPSVTYHLSRIVRELISNILHHANATGVELAISYQDNNLSISIADNGEGLDPVAPDSGGLANIRFRAERLKAEVHWQNTAPGTRCVLHVPIQAQARL